jgi:hypothetical protein
MAPVTIGALPALELDAAAVALDAMDVLADGTPDVYGAAVTLLAPEKPTVPAVELVGAPPMLAGF